MMRKAPFITEQISRSLYIEMKVSILLIEMLAASPLLKKLPETGSLEETIQDEILFKIATEERATSNLDHMAFLYPNEGVKASKTGYYDLTG